MAENAIRVEGMRELRRKLGRYGGPELRKEMNAAIKEGVTRDVTPNAQKLAPKLTGRLARSIRPRVSAKGVFISARRPYANPIHWGWPRRNIEPQRFLLDAVTQHGENFAGQYERIMRGYARRVTDELNSRNRRSRGT